MESREAFLRRKRAMQRTRRSTRRGDSISEFVKQLEQYCHTISKLTNRIALMKMPAMDLGTRKSDLCNSLYGLVMASHSLGMVTTDKLLDISSNSPTSSAATTRGSSTTKSSQRSRHAKG